MEEDQVDKGPSENTPSLTGPCDVLCASAKRSGAGFLPRRNQVHSFRPPPCRYPRPATRTPLSPPSTKASRATHNTKEIAPIETAARRQRSPAAEGEDGILRTPARSPRGQRLIPRSSRTSPPEAPASPRPSPQRRGLKDQLTAGIPAYSRSGRKRQDRPVTPEVAGSSPVAPALAANAVVLGVAGSRANVIGCGSLDTHPSRHRRPAP
jgi:hypothetical protein